MSWHVIVATNLPPATSTLVAWIATRSDLELDGAIDGVHRMAIVRRRETGREPARVAAIVYAPEPIEEGDLAPLLADAVLSPRFRLRIAVPGANGLDRDVAASLAAAVALESQGAVFDPQAEEILAPASVRRLSRTFAIACPAPQPSDEPDALVPIEITDARGVTRTLHETRASLAEGGIRCRIVRVAEDDDGREIILVDAGGATLEVTRDQLVER